MLPFICTAALATLAGFHPPQPRPRLVVVLMVDQLRPDYLDRYRDQWTGGFRRILDQAAYFPDGQQDHALTQTAPGHASVLSGRFPAHTGIPSNTRGVEDRAAPLLGSSGTGASPRRFHGTELYDWILNRDSSARQLSVSRKDRSAILLVGRVRGQVYWYNDGIFTTSRYYADVLPDWVTDYNARRGPQRLAGTTWTPLLSADRYSESDSMPYENDSADVSFPHRFPNTPELAAADLPSFPWMDSLTLDLALVGVTALQLGRHEGTDLLTISLSASDAVGHAFGPDSKELHDMLLRLDHWLGWFEDSLGVLVPSGRTIFALSSDHGVQSFPEWTTGTLGKAGGRVWLADLAQETAARLRRRYQTNFQFEFDDGLLTADLDLLRAHGIAVDSMASALAEKARGRPGVTRVFTPATLRAARSSDREARLWRHNLGPDSDWLFAAVLAPGFTWQASGGSTSHGTTNLLDTTVPIAFWGPGIRPGRYTRPVNSVDIGPTLAALVGVAPTEAVDGVALPEVVTRSSTH
ncbi:MAG: alkaline phosphatase family protein [Gemmatimonadota bacterium]